MMDDDIINDEETFILKVAKPTEQESFDFDDLSTQSEEAIITNYDGESKDVVIPSQV